MTYLYLSDEEFILDGKTIPLGEQDGKYKYMTTKEHEGEGIILVGEWVNSGQPVSLDIDLYEGYFLEFANGANGSATDKLDYAHWQGHQQRKMQEVPVNETLPEYPSTAQPFVLRMERYEDTESGWQGWYWTATIEFNDPNREPTNYAIGIYNSDWEYLYTTGKYYLKDTGEVDEDGEPIMKYVTSCPPGYQTAEPEDIHFAMLLGSEQRGRMVLAAGSDSIERYFWADTSGE